MHGMQSVRVVATIHLLWCTCTLGFGAALGDMWPYWPDRGRKKGNTPSPTTVMMSVKGTQIGSGERQKREHGRGLEHPKLRLAPLLGLLRPMRFVLAPSTELAQPR